MLKSLAVDLGNFILSFSDAIDLANASIASHQMRTAFIAWRVAQAANLPRETIEKIFIAALLHDIGALSVEEKIRLTKFEESDDDPHCILGESFFNLTPLLAPAAKIVRFHHKPWHLWDVPLDSPDVMEAQILTLSDLLERHISRDQLILHQVDDLRSKMIAYAGTEIHPDLISVFVDMSRREDFWLDLTSTRLYSLLLHSGPFVRAEIHLEDLFSMAELFCHIVDFRSRFTATHSTGVTACAGMLSRIFGLTENEAFQTEIAAYLHDLGKMAVPNSILEKPDKLTKTEFEVIRQHTYFTYSVLNSIGGLDNIAEWAAFHHEKLDGSGYPFHIAEPELGTGARIMAVADIFTALAEDRPYRKGMNRKEIKKIITADADNNVLDRQITNLLLENYGEISARVKEQQALSVETYNQKFINAEKAILPDPMQ